MTVVTIKEARPVRYGEKEKSSRDRIVVCEDDLKTSVHASSGKHTDSVISKLENLRLDTPIIFTCFKICLSKYFVEICTGLSKVFVHLASYIFGIDRKVKDTTERHDKMKHAGDLPLCVPPAKGDFLFQLTLVRTQQWKLNGESQQLKLGGKSQQWNTLRQEIIQNATHHYKLVVCVPLEANMSPLDFIGSQLKYSCHPNFMDKLFNNPDKNVPLVLEESKILIKGVCKNIISENMDLVEKTEEEMAVFDTDSNKLLETTNSVEPLLSADVLNPVNLQNEFGSTCIEEVNYVYKMIDLEHNTSVKGCDTLNVDCDDGFHLKVTDHNVCVETVTTARDDRRTDHKYALPDVSERSDLDEKKKKHGKDVCDGKVLMPGSDAGENQSNDYVETIRELTRLPLRHCLAPPVGITVNMLEQTQTSTTVFSESQVPAPTTQAPPQTIQAPDLGTQTGEGNSLDIVLKRIARGEEVGPRITMKFELLRLCTLRNYPKNNKPYLIRLAQAGFYYAADGDELTCYCCGLRRRDWTADCNPLAIHRRMSPRCSFLVNNSEVNIGVPREVSSEGSDRFANLRELLGESPDTQTGNDSNLSARLPDSTQQNSSTSSDSSSGIASTTRRVGNRNPKHPHYGVQSIRLNSYVGWPSSSHQTPATLAEAGFYYAGIGDCVRCFHCGVGLRHWAAEDNPWIEHGRWTLENPCLYLIQMKGEEFLSIIRMAIEITDNQPPQMDSNTPPASTIPSVGTSNHGNRPVTQTSTGNSPVVCKGGNSSSSQASKKSSNQTKDTTKSATGKCSNEQRQLKEENRRLRQQTLCRVCEERDICIVFLPCGHLVTCAECAPTLRVCPVCNKSVKGTVKTYMS